MGRKGYGCSHYKEGCRFVIWKESFGRNLNGCAGSSARKQRENDEAEACTCRWHTERMDESC